MANIKSLALITAKWRKRANESTQDYADGVQNSTVDWAGQTIAAAASYKAGIQAAIAANRFEGGVRAAGTAKWKANTIAKGPQRWAQGIGLSGDAYAKGFAPYREIIANLTLPARGARGDAANYARSMAVGKALHDKRMSLK